MAGRVATKRRSRTHLVAELSFRVAADFFVIFTKAVAWAGVSPSFSVRLVGC